MTLASKLITCAVILHNLAIQFGDDCETFNDEPEIEEGLDPESHLPVEDQGEGLPVRAQRERRRNQLLQFFTRN